MAFSDARIQAPQPVAKDVRNFARPDFSTAEAIGAFGNIAGDVREGIVKGNLEKDLGESGNIIDTINADTTVGRRNRSTGEIDPTLGLDISASDTGNEIDQTSFRYKRIAAGVKQGKISQSRGRLEAEVVLREAISKAPGFADELRQLASTILPFNPSSQVMGSLFLSGPDDTARVPQTETQKMFEQADMMVATGFKPDRASAVKFIRNGQIREAEKELRAIARQERSDTDANYVNGFSLDLQDVVNSRLLIHLTSKEIAGDSVDTQATQQSITREGQAMLAQAFADLKLAGEPISFELRNELTKESERIIASNNGLLESDDILKVLGRRVELAESVAQIAAWKIAPALLVVDKAGGQAAVTMFLELMAASNGDKATFEEMIKINGQFAYLGNMGLAADKVAPAIAAALGGEVIDEHPDPNVEPPTQEEQQAVLKALALYGIDGQVPPKNLTELQKMLADSQWEMGAVSLSSIAATRNSFANHDQQTRSNIATQFKTQELQHTFKISDSLAGTGLKLGWNPEENKFHLERQDNSVRTLGSPSVSSFLGGFDVERPETLRSSADADIDALNSMLLPVITQPGWALEFGFQDPNQWASQVIADINKRSVFSEIPGDGAIAQGTGDGIRGLPVEQQVKLRDLMRGGDKQAVIDGISEIMGVPFNETAESLDFGFTKANEGEIFISNAGETFRVVDGKLTNAEDNVQPKLEVDFKSLGVSGAPDPAMLSLVTEEANKAGLPEGFMEAVVGKESHFDPNAVSPTGAEGLGQFTNGGAIQDLVNAGFLPEGSTKDNLDLFNPELNAAMTARYLSILLDRAAGDMELALAAYNGGAGNLKKAGGNINGMRLETRDFVKKILESMGIEPQFIQEKDRQKLHPKEK